MITTKKLNELAKKANVNLNLADSVWSFLNAKGTKIHTIFYITDIDGVCAIGGTDTMLSSVIKRGENECEYYTDGIQMIDEIRANA